MAFTAIPIVLHEAPLVPGGDPDVPDDKRGGMAPLRTPSAHAGVTEKRRRLRLTAARMFAERGVAGTSLQSLARHAGIGAGRLTSYYDGKQDLLAEVMHDHLAALGLRVDIAAAAEAGGRPEDQLAAMVLAFLEGVQADRAAHRVLVQESRFLAEAERQMVRTRYKLLAYAFGDPLVAAVPALRPHPALAKTVVLSLVGMASNTAFWFRPNGVVDLPTYAALLTQMTLTGARGLGRKGKRRMAGPIAQRTALGVAAERAVTEQAATERSGERLPSGGAC
jgi:AcrR family transcriptional regulator